MTHTEMVEALQNTIAYAERVGNPEMAASGRRRLAKVTDPEPTIEQRTADPASWYTWRHRQMMAIPADELI